MPPRKPVTEDQIDLVAGKAKDVRALHRYAEQQGAAAVPLLLRAMSSPSAQLRIAAFEALTPLDLAQAEALALAGANGAEGLKSKKARIAALAPLRIVATPDCLDRVLELGESVSSWELTGAARSTWAPRRLACLTEVAAQLAFIRDWFAASSLRENDDLLERVRELLGSDLATGARVELARQLVKSGQGEVRDADVLLALAQAAPHEDWAGVLTDALRDPPELGLALLRGFSPATVERAPADEVLVFSCAHGLLDFATAAATRLTAQDLRPYGPLRNSARSWRMRGLDELADRADRLVPGISQAP